MYRGRDSFILPPTHPTAPKRPIRGSAAPRPWLSIVETKDKEVVLKCEAEGLVYKPELVLLNSKGTILPADEATERPMDSEGLYTVTRYFTVQKTATNVFTCRVQQLEIKHMRETQIRVPDKMFQEEYPLERKVGIGFLGAVVGSVVGAVVVFLFMRRNAEETNGGCADNGIALLENSNFHEIRILLDQLSELLSLGPAEVFPHGNFDRGRGLLSPGPRYAQRLLSMPPLQ
ncbi:uncharacterized protein LOC120058732 [Salvelinus namaycush]|uniref:Uncharacterized protein LOC120058732 n=1 Tax=Salvelinus namaycush TaxID=8040 RepID=A0A8U1C0X0_SALNM|nr:uncharacterized protein LOC120058732 [Salvelinus namaycush]